MNFGRKIAIAIERIKIHQPRDGYYLAFSGGKDSCVIKALADMAGAKYDAHYSVTTIDPPPVVYFIRQHHKDVIWDRPEVPLLKKLETRGFPKRQSRWCCELYKENGGWGRTCLLGVRAAESRNRADRKVVGRCFKNPIGKTFVNPIIDWTEKDVWQFIGKFSVPYCKIYDEGFTRVGCLFCPFKPQRVREAEAQKYPAFAERFIVSFNRLHTNRCAKGKSKFVKKFPSGREMFYWWLTGKGAQKDDSLDGLL
jgi:phosphoadenosine phosphosulfate reductase